MGTPIKILIVEDEMVIAANISLQLSNLGYTISGIFARGEDALIFLKENKPDIILLDIQLKGKLDGIETAQFIQEKYQTPIIYLTANANDTHFNRAKATKPYAFISKPFKKLNLQRAIELTLSRIVHANSEKDSINNVEVTVLSDCIFVKHHDKMVKININNIFYIEAERNYSRIFSKNKEHLIVMTLKDINEKLPKNNFLRIHRSYIINLAKVDEVAGSHVVISKKAIPLSKKYRSQLLNRLHTI